MFREILVSLLNAGRATGNMVDKTQAKIDCQNLINSGIKKWGDKEVILVVLTILFFSFYCLFDGFLNLFYV